MSNAEIANKLRTLYERLDNTRELTSYTANEGEQAANKAAKLVEAWQAVEEQEGAAKAAALSNLEKAVAAASNKNSPWGALTKTQDAIESFLHEVGEEF